MDRKKPCLACQFSFMEPDGPFCCGHKLAGTFGLSLSGTANPRQERGFCGPEGKFFEQHPLRNEDGTLKIG